ncbi:hypothetical protein [Sphingomonas hankookensis]
MKVRRPFTSISKHSPIASGSLRTRMVRRPTRVVARSITPAASRSVAVKR